MPCSVTCCDHFASARLAPSPSSPASRNAGSAGSLLALAERAEATSADAALDSQSAGFALRHPPKDYASAAVLRYFRQRKRRHSSIGRETQRGVLRFQADHPRSCDHQRSRAAGRCSSDDPLHRFGGANRMKRRGIGWKPPGPNGFPGKKQGASPSVQLRISSFPSMSCRLAAKRVVCADTGNASGVGRRLIWHARPSWTPMNCGPIRPPERGMPAPVAPWGWRPRSENRVGSQAQAFTGS